MMSQMADSANKIKSKYLALAPLLDERGLGLWAAAEADALDSGEAVKLVSQATGISRKSIRAGLSELASARNRENGRRRGPGAGRKSKLFHHPELPLMLEELFSPVNRGECDSPLRWTTRSLAELETELRRLGVRAGRQTLDQLLNSLGYSLQGKRRSPDGTPSSNRNHRFETVNAAVGEALGDGAPVFSLDSRRSGRLRERLRPIKPPPEEDREAHLLSADNDDGGCHPAAIGNVVFLSGGLLNWWRKEGRKANPPARRLVTTVDPLAGGGLSPDIWRRRLERLSRMLGLELSVHFLPPGTFKWNLPCRVLAARPTLDWHGRILPGYETVLRLMESPESDAVQAGGGDESLLRLGEAEGGREPVGRNWRLG